jgi:hypothetical protein
MFPPLFHFEGTDGHANQNKELVFSLMLQKIVFPSGFENVEFAPNNSSTSE